MIYGDKDMAYKVMIVDDDMNFRFALREMIPWEENGCTVAAEAIHGKQALEKMEESAVDVVLTDMDMPVMNGVELTRELKKQYPEVIIVACSAFDDFSFVKESMRLGAEDYLLKQEFNGETIIQTILKLLNEKRSRKHTEVESAGKQKQFYAWLCGEETVPARDFPESRRIWQSDTLFLLLFYNTGTTNRIYEQSDVEILYQGKITEDRWIVLLNRRPVNRRLEQYAGSSRIAGILCGCFDGTVQAGFCEMIGKAEELPELYRRAEIALEQGSYAPRDRIFRYEDCCIPGRIRDIPEGAWTTGSKSPEEISSGLREILLKYRPGEDAVNRLLTKVFRDRMRALTLQEAEELSFYEEIRRRWFLEDKLAYLSERLDALSGNMYTGSHPEIRSAIQYIRGNYDKDISLGEIAAEVGLSENYFSNLFKQETGENLTMYVNKIRIEEGTKMLDTSSLKVYEIAEKVGFRNTTYFSTTFRKITGMTVSEYKNKKQI